jgi:hypothetical protein
MEATGSASSVEEHSGAGTLSEPTSLSATGRKDTEGAGAVASSVSMVATGERHVPEVPYVSDVWVALPPTKHTITGSPSVPRRRRVGESMWWVR